MIKNYTLSKEYPFTQNGIREALKTIKDPEIDINIVDLGLIQDIQIDENKNVKITLIFTSSLCPLTQVIKEDIEKTVRKNFKTKKVKVVSDDTKLWNVDMMTEDGKENFKDFFK
ncbi:MAG: metal-sulfur cluster assembly factor [Candidatus Cloacimonetes bacterium]|nr:metal-sulfur cluster assembly factor [Candidatus Cloacimonadota bacterium]MBL7107823.1 metal-sulfur cluster assembly factor [Candidatus Cloacimonadota bacterium]